MSFNYMMKIVSSFFIFEECFSLIDIEPNYLSCDNHLREPTVDLSVLVFRKRQIAFEIVFFIWSCAVMHFASLTTE